MVVSLFAFSYQVPGSLPTRGVCVVPLFAGRSDAKWGATCGTTVTRCMRSPRVHFRTGLTSEPSFWRSSMG